MTTYSPRLEAAKAEVIAKVGQTITPANRDANPWQAMGEIMQVDRA